MDNKPEWQQRLESRNAELRELAAYEDRLTELKDQSAALEWAANQCPVLWRLVEWLAKLGRGDEAMPQSAGQ